MLDELRMPNAAIHQRVNVLQPITVYTDTQGTSRDFVRVLGLQETIVVTVTVIVAVYIYFVICGNSKLAS